MKIKILTLDDWQAYKALRLEALQKSPTNFGSSFEEEKCWPDELFQEVLNNNTIFGAFVDSKLVGCVGLNQMTRPKTMHKAELWGMYVDPSFCRQGIGDALVKALLAYAHNQGIIQIYLTCVTTTTTTIVALKLYRKNGFEVYGTEPNAIKVNGKFFDEHLMFLRIL